MTNIAIHVIHPGSPEVATCARWRVEAFAGVLGPTFEDERRSLEAFVADQTQQVALFATRGGVPAGTCLLVPNEIDPKHAVSPWLAGLYVTPEHRRFGVGRTLVRAIEEHARTRGHVRLHLYTDDAGAYYERLGWRTVDRVDWKGYPTALMVRDLGSE